MVKVKFKRLRDDAVVPVRAHDSDAGFDLVAAMDTVFGKMDEDGNLVYGTGLALEIPAGYVGLVFPRSSIARVDMMLSNGVGVIDSGYRGEVMAKFKMIEPKRHDEYHAYFKGERIAQLVIMRLPDVEMEEVSELGSSERGDGGYGSSGR